MSGSGAEARLLAAFVRALDHGLKTCGQRALRRRPQGTAGPPP
eukprot:gene48867-32467_t